MASIKSASNTIKASSASLTSFLEQNTGISNFVFVCIVILLFLLLFSAGNKILQVVLNKDSPYLIKGMISGTTATIISQDPGQTGAIPLPRSNNQSEGIEFTYSVWLNITDLDANSSQYKHVFSKGDNASINNGLYTPNNAPGLYIGPDPSGESQYEPTLVVIMNTFTSINETVVVRDIPLQKWLNVILRVNGAYLDVYVNGTLAKRHTLNGVAKQNNGDVYVCKNGGFNGYLSDLRYYNTALSPGNIVSITQKGPNMAASSVSTNDLNNIPPYFSTQWYFKN